MADAKMIRVSEEVHAKVADIAYSNYRGLGDQVAYWADHTCTHPVEARIELNYVASPVSQNNNKKHLARLGKGQPFRGFVCSVCGAQVLPGLPDEVAQAINKPIEVVK